MESNECVQCVKQRWDEVEKELRESRSQFRLNQAFDEGYQWLWWDERRNTVTPLVEDSERPRRTFNKLSPRIRGLIGRLVTRNLAWDPAASAPDDASMMGARLATLVIEHQAEQQAWEQVREEAVHSAILGGTSAVVVEWDPNGRNPLWWDDQSQQVKGYGDTRLRCLSIDQFGLEPGSARQQDARWWVSATCVPPGQVRDLYDLDWTPSPDATTARSPVMRTLARRGGSQVDLVTVYTMYERPNRACPKGRMAVVVNDKAVVDRDWPFPFKERLNIEVFRQSHIKGCWYGRTMVTEARPLQVAYNIVRNNIVDHSDLVGNARMMMPIGSVQYMEQHTDLPGEVIPYDNQIGQPGYLSPPQLPRWLTSEPAQLEAEMDDILHTHEVARGAINLERQAASAIAIVAEKNDTPLGIMSREQASGWGEIGSMVLAILEAETKSPREIVVTLGEVTYNLRWTGKMLNKQTRVRVPLEATLPQSRAANQAMLTSIRQAFPAVFEGVDPSSLARLLDLPGQRHIVAALDPDASLAQTENHHLAQGRAMIPEKWHDHAKHIAEHNAYRNSVDYLFADQDVKDLFELHMQAHEQLVLEEAQQQAALNAVEPGLAGIPQGHNPIGSAVPEPLAVRRSQPAAPAA